MRQFWFLTSAASVSKLGNAFLNLALPWAVLQSTSSPELTALSVGVQNVPYLFSPVLGGLMDRYDRRRVFLVSELVQGFAVAVLPLLLAAGRAALAMVLLLVAGTGAAVSNLTSDFSLVPALSPPHRVSEAYGKYAAATSTARCVGPAVAGLVLASAGTSTALWIDAATFLVTAAVAVTLPGRRTAPVRTSFPRMLSEGFRGFRRLRGIPRLTLVIALHNLGAGAIAPIVVVVARSGWDWSSRAAGLALAAGAAGSAVGGRLGARVLSGATLERRIQAWFVVCVLASAVLLVPRPATVVCGFFLLMVGEGAMNVTTNEYRFRAIPDALVGRVNSLMRAFIVGATVVSSPLLGWSSSLPYPALRLAPVFLASLPACGIWFLSGRTADVPGVPAPPPRSTEPAHR
jgi:MFS family permease